MLYLLYLSYGTFLQRLRNVELVGYRYCCQEVEYVTSACQVRGVTLAYVASAIYAERCLAGGVFNLHSPIVCLGVLHAVRYRVGVAVYFSLGYHLRVEVYHTHTALGQSLYKLKLCAEDVLYGVECLQVHLTNSSNYAYRRVYQIAYLANVAPLFSSHLYDEDFVVRLQVLTYGADNTQCGVEVTRCH